MLVLLIALVSLASASFFPTCNGTIMTSGCMGIPAAQCLHYYSASMVNGVAFMSSCYLPRPGECWESSGCYPTCTGTTYIANCVNASANYCAGYYSTDSSGSYTCALNTATNKCVVPSPRYPCTPNGSVQCNGPYGYATGWSCASFTTQATCSNAWLGPFNGQKNQCAWDAAGNYCYLGKPCHY